MTGTTPESLVAIARNSLGTDDEEAAALKLRAGAKKFNQPQLWQWTALLERAQDRLVEALDAIGRAAILAPDDAGIAHAGARITHEAGIDARASYARARLLAPADGSVLIGEIAARAAVGDGARAADDLASLLHANPRWIAGHEQFAQLQAFLGRPDCASQSLDAALALVPAEETLWSALLELAIRREAFSDLEPLLDRASRAGVMPPYFQRFAAIGSSESGNSDRAETLFAQLPPSGAPIWRIRHLLRTGRAREALPLIDVELAGLGLADALPYAYLAWRLTGDRRLDWLTGHPGSIAVYDLADQLPPLSRLKDVLTKLHQNAGQFLDQSVRGGSQTDGPLFMRIDPDIVATRAAVVASVERYRSALPPRDLAHPLLGARRDGAVRFAGSWSVRLSAGGKHSSHTHPQGWISSALYVALPPPGFDHAGWLSLGDAPPDLGLSLSPLKVVEPRPGRLVLFPSWLWHSTIPFAEGKRLTIAFDIARPS